MMHYKTRGTCSTAIDLEIEGGKITACRFTNGCRGNTVGLARLAVGQDARGVVRRRSVPRRHLLPRPAQPSD